MNTHSKIDNLSYALARARYFVKIRADNPAEIPGFQEWAQIVLADIDEALEGTIYANAAKAEDEQ